MTIHTVSKTFYTISLFGIYAIRRGLRVAQKKDEVLTNSVLKNVNAYLLYMQLSYPCQIEISLRSSIDFMLKTRFKKNFNH